MCDAGELRTPLAGIRIVEFEGIGPGPIAGNILLSMGASVTLIARPSAIGLMEQLQGDGPSPLEQGKQRIALDLKSSDADRARALDLVAGADAVIEGLRPGVMERLGFGPADCEKINPRIVYGRVTGWGQSGPLANAAGHDLNYVALSGLLALSARAGQAPIVPPTVLGDGAGALGLAFGMVCALFDAARSNRGRVVDAAIVDVTAMIGMLAHTLHGAGQIGTGQPSAFHDSPFYDVYECADGRFVTIGALEPQFYALLLKKLGFDDVDPATQYDPGHWPELKARVARRVRERTRDAWCDLLEGTDVCFAPVLTPAEAHRHPHNIARETFAVTGDARSHGRAAPRFLPLSTP